MTPRRPKVVELFGKNIKIEYLQDLGEPNVQGLFFAGDRLIQVLDDDQWPDHLLHEILHAIFNLTGHSNTLGEEIEEALVVALENGLSDIFLFKKTSPKFKY